MAGGNRGRTFWITRTAVFAALLIVLQAASALLANPYLTGCVVNMALIVSVVIGGYATGLTVAVISPVAAKLVGIGPFWSLIPAIAAGNAALVTVWHFVCGGYVSKRLSRGVIALIAAAIAKFAVLYIGVARIIVPYFLKLPETQANVISSMFSVQQLITASVGGVLAIMVLPALRKAVDVWHL